MYNLRKRGGDSADKYFKSTELIAGVKDMRFQRLMPDVLHWLGIKKIDNMVSMSDMYVLSLLHNHPSLLWLVAHVVIMSTGNTTPLFNPAFPSSNDMTFQVRLPLISIFLPVISNSFQQSISFPRIRVWR